MRGLLHLAHGQRINYRCEQCGTTRIRIESVVKVAGSKGMPLQRVHYLPVGPDIKGRLKVVDAREAHGISVDIGRNQP